MKMEKKIKSIISIITISLMLLLTLCSCVDQSGKGKAGDGDSLVATSPAVADICSRLELPLEIGRAHV